MGISQTPHVPPTFSIYPPSLGCSCCVETDISALVPFPRCALEPESSSLGPRLAEDPDPTGHPRKESRLEKEGRLAQGAEMPPALQP